MKLDSQTRADLQSALDRLTPVLEEFRKSSGDYETLLQKYESIESLINEGEETVDFADAAAVATLETQKAQRRLLGERIENRSGKLGPFLDAIRVELNNAQFYIERGLQPVYHDLLERVTKALLPFSDDRARAVALAKQSDLIRAFGSFMHLNYALRGDYLRAGQEVLDIYTKILSGTFEFNYRCAKA